MKHDGAAVIVKYRVNTQQREYRLRTPSKVLTEHETAQKLQSILKAREPNKERQRRYRLNQSYEKKSLSREKDRNSKRLKRTKTTTGSL